MKFCAQCGERLDDASAFCSRCGAKQAGFDFEQKVSDAADNAVETAEGAVNDAETVIENAGEEIRAEYDEAVTAVTAYSAADYKEPRPVKKRRRGWIIAAIVAAALLLSVGALAATGAYTSLIPHSKLKLGLAERSLFNTSVQAVNRALPEQDGLNADFELGVDIDPGEMGGFYADYYGQIFDIINNLKLFASVDTRECLDLSVRGDYKGNTAADLRLFVEKDKFGVYIAPADDDLYTITRTALLGKLAPELDPAKTDFLFDKIDKAALRQDSEAIADIVKKALKEADIAIEKNVPVDLFNDGEQIKAAVYTITLTEEQIKALLTDIADYLDSDDCYLADYANDWIILLNELAVKEIDEDMDLYLDDFEDYAGIDDVIANFREKIPELAKQYVEDGYKLEAVMKGNDIVRQRIYNDDGSFGYDAIAEGNEEHFMVYADDDEERVLSADVNRVVNGDNVEVKCVANVSEGNKLVVEGKSDLSKRSVIGTHEGVWDFVATDADGETIGTAHVDSAMDKNSRMKHLINVKPGADMEAEFNELTIDFLAGEGDGVERPAGVEEVDISDYSDTKLTRLISSIVLKLYSNIGGIFG